MGLSHTASSLTNEGANQLVKPALLLSNAFSYFCSSVLDEAIAGPTVINFLLDQRYRDTL